MATVVDVALSSANPAASLPRSTLSRTWPTALGVLVAAGTAYGLTDGRDIAAVVVASGFVTSPPQPYDDTGRRGRRSASRSSSSLWPSSPGSTR